MDRPVILSDEGLDAITAREGSVATMYRDSAGLPTIGVGHLLTKDELSSGKLTALGVDWHQDLTPRQITELLQEDTSAAARAVSVGVKVTLSQNQFDALCSFCFNVGTAAFLGSTLLKVLNAGDYASVPVQMQRWIYAGGQVSPILEERRRSEVAQWLG